MKTLDNSDLDSTTEIYSSTDLGDNVSNSSNSDPPQALSTPSTSPSRTIPNTPPATPPPAAHSSLSTSTSTSSTNPSQQPPTATLPTLEDRLNQLRQKLQTVNAERETLASSLKSARRESNKKDAALKAEIEALKRSSEKFSANEIRQRQKNLALQESVKRAQAATKETQQLVRDVELEVPEVLKEKEIKEKEHESVKRQAEKVGKEKKARLEEERKRREGMQNELAAMTNKLEKLSAKKERQETVVIPSLEDKLQQVQNEIEEEERVLEMLDRMERERDSLRNYEVALAQQQALGLLGTSSVNGSPTQAYPATRVGYPGTEGYQRHIQTRSRGRSFDDSPQLPISGRAAPISRPSLPGPIQRPNFSNSSTPPQPLHGKRGSIEEMHDFSPVPGVHPYGNTIWGPPSSLSTRTGPPLVASPISSTPTINNDELDGRTSRRQDSFASTTAQKLARMLTTGSSSELDSETFPRQQRRSGSPPSPTSGIWNAGGYNLVPSSANRGATGVPSASTSTSSLNNNASAPPPPPLTPPGLLSSSTSAPSNTTTTANNNGGNTSTSSLGSTLSSRAPVFEPRKGGLGFGLKIFTSSKNASTLAAAETPGQADAASSSSVPNGRQALGSGRPGGNPGVIGAGRSGSGGSSKS
jgi:chemotaxis protein histidine kinase CheA